MPKETIREEEIALPEVKKILEQRQEAGELSYVQKVTLDYATKLSKLSDEKAKELKRRLAEEVGVPRGMAVQIVNLMPHTVDELRTLLAGQSKVFLPSEMERILSILNEYREERV